MTQKEQVLKIMRDYEWHCCVHEFNGISSQIASVFKSLENDGCVFAEDPTGRKNQYNIFHSWKKYCKTCGKETEHRKLLKEPK